MLLIYNTFNYSDIYMYLHGKWNKFNEFYCNIFRMPQEKISTSTSYEFVNCK
jgi:hypothetical protein